MNLPWTTLAEPAAQDSPVYETDVLVIGGGVAGFSAAIAAADAAEVLVVTKDGLRVSNTQWAQGGVAAVLGEEDSFQAHRDDTIATGGGLCDRRAVEVVVSEGPDRIRELIEWGGNFDREGDELHLTLEGGHTQKRVVHAHGDQTGAEVQGTLIRRVQQSPQIKVWEHAFALDLVLEEGHCRGALVRRQDGVLIRIRARAVILCTGGAGQIYRETTNPPIATADGFAMALRAGARLRDMEFVQFHPTTLYVAGSARHLITEAVRGEGGYLRDISGERFMVNYDPRAELAPRDIVSRSIINHMKATGDNHVCLDLTHLGEATIQRRFPKLVATCELFNIDVTRARVPVHPSAHYIMGGIEVDMEARSAVPGLFACGEVASSGLHGANRLASNSLLEGFVFGRRAGLAAVDEAPLPKTVAPLPHPDFALEGSVLNVADMLNSIKSLMWREVGVIRSGPRLERAVRLLHDWSRYVFQCRFHEPVGWELVNVLSVAHAVASSALAREESRGAHFRTDFPESSAPEPRHSCYPESDPEHDG